MSRGHVELSPSSTHRWWHCAGSVNAERGLPNPGNEHTQLGTAAHALAELAWKEQKPARHYLDTAFAVDDDAGGEIHIVADAEMVEAVQVLLDVYALEADEADQVWFEVPVPLDALKPPAPMGGRLDFGAFKNRWIRVTDYKHGRGVVVEAANNVQGRSYALGLWLKLIAEAGSVVNIEGVAVTIVQPRAFHPDGPVRTELIPIAEFKAWAKELMVRAAATIPADAPRTPGDHCKFCRAKATCPALRMTALAVAQIEFSDLVVGPPNLRSAALMTPDEVAAYLNAKRVLEAWMSAMDGRAMADLEAGRPIPGWGLRAKRGQRKLVSSKAVIACLEVQGVPDALMYEEPALKSVAQMEKAIKPFGAHIPRDLIVSESSGLTLCKLDGATALPASSEFGVIAA